MQKKVLEKIEPLSASPAVQQMARRIKLTADYVATARFVTGKKTLEVSLFSSREAAKRQVKPEYRLFFERNDFLTEQLEQTHGIHVKWMTAGYDRIGITFVKSTCNYNKETHQYDYFKADNVVLVSDHVQKMVEKFLREDCTDSVWLGMKRYQEKIQAARRKKKYDAERKKIDSELAIYKKLPANVEKWGWTHVMEFCQYGVFDKYDKNMITLHCNCCGATTFLNQKKEGIKWNGEGQCPACHKKIKYLPRTKTKSCWSEQRWMSYVDPVGGKTTIRYFLFERYFRHGEVSSEHVREYVRTVITEWNGRDTKTKDYEYREFPDRGVQWNTSIGKIGCGFSVLYPGNLPKAWENTPMKYSAFELIGKKNTSVCLERLMGRYFDSPKIEWLIKMGLTSIVQEISYNYPPYYQEFDFSKETIYQIIGLNKVNTKLLCEINGDIEDLKIIRLAEKNGIRIEKEQIAETRKLLGHRATEFWEMPYKATYHKKMRFLREQSENRLVKYEETLGHWKDYLRMAERIGLPVNDEYYLFPKDLHEAHERVRIEYVKSEDARKKKERLRAEREANKKLKQAKKLMEQLLKNSDGTDALHMKGTGLMIVVPASAAEIKNEGAFLHHCVGSYVDRVASGETMILFIRKIEEPDTPFYTLEYRDGRVIQCYGMRNCKTTAEVQGFVDAFEKKMQKAS